LDEPEQLNKVESDNEIKAMKNINFIFLKVRQYTKILNHSIDVPL
jgi:hypothetical protein